MIYKAIENHNLICISDLLTCNLNVNDLVSYRPRKRLIFPSVWRHISCPSNAWKFGCSVSYWAVSEQGTKTTHEEKKIYIYILS